VLMKYFLITILIFFSICGKAQFYHYGEEPTSLKWKKIESPRFMLIYPEGKSAEAEKIMRLLEISYTGNSEQLAYNPKKIPVILHYLGTRSNGFVMWAPKRSEFFLHPDVTGFTQDWYTQLALHEYRHIVQVEKLDQGFTKILTTILGEQGIGPAMGMIPFWFIEGDAVYAETSLSNSGRGRIPSFEMEIKAHILESSERFSYDKAYLGSFKNFVPDYYRLGYQMVSYARKNYGIEFWNAALDQTGRKTYQLAPFYFYLKKKGLSSEKLYSNTMDFLGDHWKNNQTKRNPEKIIPFETRKNNDYVSYNFPHILNDSSIIAVKSSLDEIDKFVRLFPNGKETTLFVPGYLYSGSFSADNNIIVWDEQQPDVRWRNKDYSVIRMYNFETNIVKTISWKSQYSSPSYSASNNLIVVINNKSGKDDELIFLSVEGSKRHVTESPGNFQLLQPSWVPGTKKVVLTGIDQQGWSIWTYDIDKLEWEKIYAPGHFNITNPVSNGKRIYFNAALHGIDNIYSIDMQGKDLKQHSNVKYGAFEPALGEDFLAFSSYGNYGYSIARKPVSECFPSNSSQKDIRNEQAFFSSSDISEKNIVIPSSNQVSYTEKPYRKALNLFNFHSWAPYYLDYTNPSIESDAINPGFTLLSQNLLGTATTALGYEYKNNDHYLHANFTYRGLFPVISVDYTFGGFPVIGRINNEPLPATVSTNNELSLSVYQPLNLSRGKWNIGVTPSSNLRYSGSYLYSPKDTIYKKGIITIDNRFYAYAYQKTAYRDIQPRLGMIVDGSVISAPFENEHFGNLIHFKTTLYLPGILSNHGLKVRYAQQWSNPYIFLFNNKISFPRGVFPEYGIGMKMYSFDYVMPLFYPDIALKSIVYLKRVRLNLFTDYLRGDIYNFANGTIDIRDFHSSGAELYFDFHAFRFLFPFRLGVRSSWLGHEKRVQNELLFNIDINRF